MEEPDPLGKGSIFRVFLVQLKDRVDWPVVLLKPGHFSASSEPWCLENIWEADHRQKKL